MPRWSAWTESMPRYLPPRAGRGSASALWHDGCAQGSAMTRAKRRPQRFPNDYAELEQHGGKGTVESPEIAYAVGGHQRGQESVVMICPADVNGTRIRRIDYTEPVLPHSLEIVDFFAVEKEALVPFAGDAARACRNRQYRAGRPFDGAAFRV